MPPKQTFSISERKLFLRIFDISAAFLGIFFATSFQNFYYFDMSNSQWVIWLITLGTYLLFFGQIFEMYDLKNANDKYSIFKSIIITAFATTVLYIFTPYIAPILPLNRLQILYLYLAIFLPVLVWRIIYIVFIFSPKYFKNILLVGNVDEVIKLKDFIKEKAPTSNIASCVCATEDEKNEVDCCDFNRVNINAIVKEYSVTEIVVAEYDVAKFKRIHWQLVHLFEQGVTITSAKKFKEREAAILPEFALNDAFYDYITFSKNHQNRIYLVVIRMFDIIMSILGLLFLLLISPVLLIGNIFGNRGRLFYFQKRVGKKGEHFTMVKLRTMIKNAETNGAVYAVKNDYRVTPFGKFLRRSRLDEIPQFYNILKGEMAMIGPRPERPEFVFELEKELPFYAIRHVINPGLTGWAQVMHPYANTIKDQDLKVRYDLYYIKERSLLMDFKIVIKTITTVLFFRGH